MGPDCKITLAGEPVGLMDLRAGDVVDVTHDAPDAKTPQALSVTAVRPPDPGRWAVLVGIQEYDDRSLSPLDYPVADAGLLGETLVQRYRVPPDQVLMLARREPGSHRAGRFPISSRTHKPEDELIVYVGGHAYRDDDGKIYLAPKNFSSRGSPTPGWASSGWSTAWRSAPRDASSCFWTPATPASGGDLRQQPSAAEMLETLEGREAGRRCGPSRRSPAVRRGSAGTDGLPKSTGLFADSLSEGYSGRADAESRRPRSSPPSCLPISTRP